MRNKLAICALAAMSMAGAAQAQDNSFAAFAVKQAHSANFKGCDAGIRETFKDASGADMRIITNHSPARTDQVQFTTVWGDPGDVVLQQVTFRTAGGKCYAHLWTQTATSKDCGTWLQDSPRWKLVATTLGVVFTKNPGGVDAVLRPFGESCLITFSRAAEF